MKILMFATLFLMSLFLAITPTYTFAESTTQPQAHSQQKKENPPEKKQEKKKEEKPEEKKKELPQTPKIERDIFWHWDCREAWTFERVHGFFQIATNNRFRGASYTNNNFFVDGLIKYTNCRGWYLGILSGNNASVGTSLFIAPFMGYEATFCRCFFMDVSLSYTIYPKHTSPRELDYLDIIGILGIKTKCVISKIGLSYSPDYYFETGVQLYPFWNTVVQLGCRFSFILELGYEYIENGALLDLPSHFVFDVSLQRDFKGFYAGLRFVTTDHTHNRLMRPVLIGYLGHLF